MPTLKLTSANNNQLLTIMLFSPHCAKSWAKGLFMLILGVLQNFRRFDANFYVFFAIYSEAESRLVLILTLFVCLLLPKTLWYDCWGTSKIIL